MRAVSLLNGRAIRRQRGDLLEQFFMQGRHPWLGTFQQQLNRLPILEHGIGDIPLFCVELSIEFEQRDGLRFDRQKIM